MSGMRMALLLLRPRISGVSEVISPAEYLAGEHFGDDAARPGDVAAPLCEDHVILDEVTLEDQVAVDLMA